VSTFPIDFDPLAIPDPPQPEPREIRAGDTVKWQRPWNDYPPTDPAGYSLSYAIVGRAATYAVNGGMVTAGPQNFEVIVPAATTAAWLPGWYRWQAYIGDTAGNRYTIAEGKLQVLPNLQAQTTGFDDREPDEIVLDNINAMILAKSTQDVESYRVFERELRLYSWADVLNAKSVYEERVRAIRIRRGEKLPKRTIGVTFNYGY